jgi:CHAT domain-containing protein
VAHTLLVEAQWLNARREHRQAAAVAAECAMAFAQGQAWEWLLRANLQRGEALQALGASGEAEALYAGALAEAEQRELPQIVLHCLSALGALAFSQGKYDPAERCLRRALSTFDLLRATLPSEEFRISFRGDKTHLFAGLIALALQAGRMQDALQLIERARSHTLLELVDGSIDTTVQPRDAYEAGLVQQLAGLRSELNWFYHQLHRLPGAGEQLSDAAGERLRQAAHNHEAAIAGILRRLQQRSDGESMPPAGPNSLPLAELQQMLGPETAVIEYYALHGRLLAFVITNDAIHHAGDLLPESEAEQLVRRFRFQIDALRSGGRLSRHMAQLTERCVAYLRRLHEALLQPLLRLVGDRRLVIVPCGALHYLPFQALAAQDQHLVEHTEVCVAPSAGLLYRCLQQARRPVQRALLAGVPDDHTPHLAHEIEHLRTLFPFAAAYSGEAATLDALREQAPASDVLHLACHGYFRPDNPMFSALRLGDGWFTARDAYDLRLNCTLVTLSACETGINAVTPGEELLGLVRGFMAAGAPSLLVSLWPVDDETTTHFMRAFYAAWLGGAGLAQALRVAQRNMLAQNPHPFFWSPFVLYGRWD